MKTNLKTWDEMSADSGGLYMLNPSLGSVDSIRFLPISRGGVLCLMQGNILEVADKEVWKDEKFVAVNSETVSLEFSNAPLDS